MEIEPCAGPLRECLIQGGVELPTELDLAYLQGVEVPEEYVTFKRAVFILCSLPDLQG